MPEGDPQRNLEFYSGHLHDVFQIKIPKYMVYVYHFYNYNINN